MQRPVHYCLESDVKSAPRDNGAKRTELYSSHVLRDEDGSPVLFPPESVSDNLRSVAQLPDKKKHVRQQRLREVFINTLITIPMIHSYPI